MSLKLFRQTSEVTPDPREAEAREQQLVSHKEERTRLIASLERDNPTTRLQLPDDIYDFSVWTDDEVNTARDLILSSSRSFCSMGALYHIIRHDRPFICFGRSWTFTIPRAKCGQLQQVSTAKGMAGFGRARSAVNRRTEIPR